jgi:hypothetical protein
MTVDKAQPTVTADYRMRVLAFTRREAAEAEVRAWQAAGFRARLITRKGVHNVIVQEAT